MLATQTPAAEGPKTMRVNVTARCPRASPPRIWSSASLTRSAPTAAPGYAIEYAGSAVRALSMEGRMTLCNMSIESGARAGMVAPDETTFAYLQGPRPCAEGRALGHGRRLLAHPAQRSRRDASTAWSSSMPRPGALGDLGHHPRHGRARSSASARVPKMARTRPKSWPSPARLSTWALSPASRSARLPSTASSSAPAPMDAWKTCAPPPASSRATRSAPGCTMHGRSRLAGGEAAAESEGLDRIFLEAGAEWREPGCSMCLGMNPDILQPGQRCASTSNRNFEGRQGRGGRTHLVSPAMAAAAAVAGHFTDVRRLGIQGVDHAANAYSSRPGHSTGPRQHRYRPDNSQAVPQAHRAHRLRPVPV